MQLSPDNVQLLLEQVTPTDAAYVLREYGYPRGAVEPGEFYRRLVHAIAYADPMNRARFAVAGWGGLAAAATLIEGHESGADMLRGRAGISVDDPRQPDGRR